MTERTGGQAHGGGAGERRQVPRRSGAEMLFRKKARSRQQTELTILGGRARRTSHYPRRLLPVNRSYMWTKKRLAPTETGSFGLTPVLSLGSASMNW